MMVKKQQNGRLRCILQLSVFGIGALGGCDRVPPAAAPPALPAPAPASIVTPKEERPETVKIPWQFRAEPRLAATVTGKAVSMAPGQRCVKFRILPFLDFQRNTLIQDACIEIPGNTTVVVRGGSTLGIVATNGMRIGQNVRFSANGMQGRQGDRADFESISYSPKSDAEINAACVDNGNHCSCPIGNADAAAIRGHAGGAGTAAGFVRLVVSDLGSGAAVKGLVIEVSGGPGGPPGESGKRECRRGATRCESVSCTDGASNGIRGTDGHFSIAVGGAMSVSLLRTLNSSTVPAGAATVTPISSNAALQTEMRALEDAAFNGGWDRRSAQEGY